MIFQRMTNSVRRGLRARRTLVWGVSGMVIGLVMTSLGTVASAAPAGQAVPSATPTARPATCVSAPQGVVVMLENPNPGDVLIPGTNIVIQGIAYDTAATTGPGIDRVSVYLGDRDAGGLFWGDALLGQPNPTVGSGPLSTAGFSLRSPTIPTGSGGREIFVYAHSTATNKEGVTSVALFLGAAPTPVRGQVPTAVLPPPPTCTPVPPTPAPTSTPTPTPTTPPVVSVPVAPAPAPPAAPPPVAPLPAVPPPAAPAPVAPAPVAPAAAAPAPAAVAPATATTAPRGGGIPSEVGLLLLGVGAIVTGGGYVARRRERRGSAPRP